MIIRGHLRIPFNKDVVNNLTFYNPFEPEQVFKAYFNQGSDIIIPRGYPLDTTGAEISVVSAPANITVADGYALRDYQEPAINALISYVKSLEYGQCLLSAGTGSGKSYSLAKVLSQLGLKTLVLSHLTMLGSQIESELSSNLKDCSIKQLTAKSLNEPLADINIASFQLLQNIELCQYVAQHIGLVVVDEMENSVTRSRLKVLFLLKPKYFIYLTATPTRDLMKQTKAVEYLYGGKIFYMNPPEESRIHSKHVMLDYRHLHWQSPDSKQMYKTSLGAFLDRSGITQDVVALCKYLKQTKFRGTIWLVVDRTKLQTKLKADLEKVGLSAEIINGSTNTKNRNRILAMVCEEELDVLLGSAPLSAGISLPNLSAGIRLMPNSSSEELLEQMRGRLNRSAPFKQEQAPIWFDFAISGSLEYGAKKRFKIYKGSTLGVEFTKLKDFIKETKDG